MFINQRSGVQLPIDMLRDQLTIAGVKTTADPVSTLLVVAAGSLTNGDFDFIKFYKIVRLLRLPKRTVNVFLNYMTGEFFYEKQA